MFVYSHTIDYIIDVLIVYDLECEQSIHTLVMLSKVLIYYIWAIIANFRYSCLLDKIASKA